MLVGATLLAAYHPRSVELSRQGFAVPLVARASKFCVCVPALREIAGGAATSSEPLTSRLFLQNSGGGSGGRLIIVNAPA